MNAKRKFWVVSHNVQAKEGQVSDWRNAIVRSQCVFMGWGREGKQHKGIGEKFAGIVKPGDLILVARRHLDEPEVVGFGVVAGPSEGYQKDLDTPDVFGSLRRLDPFVPKSRTPNGIPIMAALGHTMALAQLHPDSNEKHRVVCDWMDRELSAFGQRVETQVLEINQMDPRLKELKHDDEPDYEVRRRAGVKRAQKAEAWLLNDYIAWLKLQGRTLHIASYRKLRCDAYEEERNNLIEAKRSVAREHIRMAAGQLLDYAFLGRERFKSPYMAILLPEKPSGNSLGWLDEINIRLIWKEGSVFLDNDRGRFT